ncbi:MAG: UvrD-helicase domain-containing protein [Planctomycetes bacterium]|nr:UvrD-helicase domain-containing protein [Planctomycetota bacterium]
MSPDGFDVARVPLHGTHLVEASAGTGKTFAIALLYLRLLAEGEGIPVDRILVATFSNAATRELRDRLRRRVREALEALQGEREADGPLARVLGTLGDAGRARRRLAEALRGFDQAQIFTLHGFCQRVLVRQAFDCGLSLEVDSTVDRRGLTEEVLADFWRKEVLGLPRADYEAFVGGPLPYAHRGPRGKACRGPEALAEFFLRLGDPSTYRVVPEDTAELREALGAALGRARSLWTDPARRGAIVAFLKDARVQALYGKKYQASWAREWDRFLGVPLGEPPLPQVVEDLARAGFASVEALEGHDEAVAFLDAMRTLHLRRGLGVTERLLAALRWLREELPARKRARGLRDFPDMLVELRDALAEPFLGERLSRVLRSRFEAALVDEFQDTDPVQYDIVRSVFLASGRPTFLVGDPKQAIYRFRGAEVQAYLKAKRAVTSPRRHTLGVNFRSEPGLVRGVAALFRRRVRPFLFDPEEVGFVEVQAQDEGRAAEDLRREGPRPARLTERGEGLPPLRLWFVGRTVAGRERRVPGHLAGEAEAFDPYKAKVVDSIARSVAAEVVRLVQGGRSGEVLIGARGVRPLDVAVLCHTHDQAATVQAALRGRGVPTVLATERGVFQTAAAGDLRTVLGAILEPHDEARVRTALTTCFFGRTAREVLELRMDPARCQPWLERFWELHEAWRRHGVARAVQAMLQAHGVEARLLARPDGERVITDLRHATELLHREAVLRGLSVAGVVQWMDSQRAREGASSPEEAQLRLETDEDAVRILTVHKSKGLEFPIVFVPYAYQGLHRSFAVDFHDEGGDHRRTVDLGSADFHRNALRAEREEFADKLRLLYVALTRARNRVVACWGPIAGFERGPLSYLLLGPEGPPDGLEVERLEAVCAPLVPSDARLSAVLKGLEEESGGSILAQDMPEADGAVLGPPGPEGAEAVAGMAPRVFPPGRVLASAYEVVSYSRLTRSEDPGAPVEVADHDALGGPASPDGSPGGESLSGFPRGAYPGSCLHELFERLDFQADEEGRRRSVREVLTAYGFDDAEHGPTVAAMVGQVLEAPILAEDPAFRLSGLARRDRLEEMEFYFPARLSPEGLAQAFRREGTGPLHARLAEGVASLGFGELAGFLTGAIDLVFRHEGRYYIVDWKSNHLGDRPEDYEGRALERAMLAHLYPLQYHIYTLGLDAYLSTRWGEDYDYRRHFGGVAYLFLRGIRAAGPCDRGVYRDRPTERLVAALRRALAGEGAES